MLQNLKIALLLATYCLLAGGGVSYADDHGMMGGMMEQKGSDNKIVKETIVAVDSQNHDYYKDSMMRMHEDMAKVVPTGNADIDFVRGMIPHHQGAIDMAKVQLEKGSDPDIKKLATEIIKAQEVEIEFMRKWLEKREMQGK